MATGIEWTDDTLNIYTGCTKVSPGCDNCYMYAMYPRLKAMGSKGYQDSPDVVRYHPDRLQKALRWTRPRMVFVNSMSDTFHPSARYEDLDDIFDALIEATERRGHIFQVLTKRPGRAATGGPGTLQAGTWTACPLGYGWAPASKIKSMPLEWRSWRVFPLRCVSCPPSHCFDELSLAEYMDRGLIQWVIVGGESGANAREMREDWARRLRDECAKFGVSYFLKQLGGSVNKRGGDSALLDGRRHTDMPVPAAL